MLTDGYGPHRAAWIASETKPETLDTDRVEDLAFPRFDEETLKTEEEPRIAGLYMNRLKQGMRLQADPTVKFATGDMTITRVLKKHLAVDSPYNTYRHGGLPPGPIVIPSVSAIDAVLHHERHK